MMNITFVCDCCGRRKYDKNANKCRYPEGWVNGAFGFTVESYSSRKFFHEALICNKCDAKISERADLMVPCLEFER